MAQLIQFHPFRFVRMFSIRNVIFILICMTYRNVTCEIDHSAESVYVDDITRAYIDIEENLWSLIGSSNRSDLVLNIHKDHLLFFRNSFSIYRRRTEKYNSMLWKLFGVEGQYLVSEFNFVKNFLLFESLDDISVNDTVQMAESYELYWTTMNHIYQRVEETNFFEEMKQVQ